MYDFFGDESYFDRVFGISEEKIDEINYKKIETAFNLAQDVRKFEIELFWKRGAYFWAFILAGYTAYFVTFDKFLENGELTLCTVMNFSPFSKIVLLILMCMNFIFCYSWVLINKGSKFWQKNWECHIDELENIFSGKLYKTILNTNSTQFDKNPLHKSAYDYSVTKITTVTSIILMIFSAILSVFHFLIIFAGIFKIAICLNYIFELVSIVFATLIIASVIVAFVTLKNCIGNIDKEKVTDKWYQRG